MALACLLQGGIALFIRTQIQHFRPRLATVSMQRTRAAHRQRKPDPKPELAVPIRDLPPLLTGLASRTEDPLGLPIDAKVALLKAVR